MTDTKVSTANSTSVNNNKSKDAMSGVVVKGQPVTTNNNNNQDINKNKNVDNGRGSGGGGGRDGQGQGGDSRSNNNPKKRKMHPGNSDGNRGGGHHGGGGGGERGQGGNRGGSGDRGDRGGSDQMGNGSNYNGPISGHRLTGAPAWDLPPQNASAQTFTGRCRLFIANLPSSVTEESLRKLFSEHGQMSEVYIGKGNQFAFIKMDTRNNAENAKNAIDGKLLDGRTLRVRLAAHAAAIKVSNLPPSVSNELLQFAFSTFGPVERAIVVADDRGRSLNEGIVEFARKSSAQAAIKKCSTESLLLSASAIPVVVSPLEARDEDEGVPEKSVLHTAEYRKEREFGPRWAEQGQIEFEICKKWKELAQIEAQRREAFDAEMRDMHENFKTQMEYYRIEETTKQLREQLRHMESQTQKFHSERDVRDDMERKREEQRRHHENLLRAQEEQLIGPYTSNQPDLNVLRRQENELRQQANVLQQMMDRQESSFRQMSGDQSMGGPHDGRMDGSMYGQPGAHSGSMMPQGQMGGGPGVNSMQMPYGGPPQPNPSTPYHQGPMPGPQQQQPLVSHHPHPMSQQPGGQPPHQQPMHHRQQQQQQQQQPPMNINPYGNGVIGPIGPPSHMMQPQQQQQQQLPPPQQMHPSQQQQPPAYMNNGGPGMMVQHGGNGGGVGGNYGGLAKRIRRY